MSIQIYLQSASFPHVSELPQSAVAHFFLDNFMLYGSFIPAKKHFCGIGIVLKLSIS